MSLWILIALVIVLIILLVFITMMWMTSCVSRSCLPGFYEADALFCKEADLKNMFMYIAPNISWFNNDYECYILMVAKHGVILNKTCTMNISSMLSCAENWSPFLSPASGREYQVVFKDLEFDDFAGQIKLKFNPILGSIRLLSGDTLLAQLHRNSRITEMLTKKNVSSGKGSLREKVRDACELSDNA
jgi:hypothetical protein